MARVKGALNTRKRHKKILKLAKGFRGAESKQFSVVGIASPIESPLPTVIVVGAVGDVALS